MKKIYLLFTALFWAILLIPTATANNDTIDWWSLWNVTVVGTNKFKPTSVLWNQTPPSIWEMDTSKIQAAIDKMNAEQAEKACEQLVKQWHCFWIKLNTNIPFIGNCIQTRKCWSWATTPVNAFPKLIWSLMSLLMTIILLMSFIMIIWSWVLMTMSWADTSKYTKWINLLKRVATWMALLWASWVILKVINPNFFV